MAAGRQQVFFARHELGSTPPQPPVAFSVRADEQVPLDAIANHFGLFPSTVTVSGLDRSLTLAQVKSRLKLSDGTAASPFIISGYLGPFSPGFTADFRYFEDRPPTRLRVLQQLHLSSRSAVYSCQDCSSSGREELVLKLILKQLQAPYIACVGPSEVETLKEIMDMKSTFFCPSLPEFLGSGIFLADGGPRPGSGDATGRLIKPRGTCVHGQLFEKSQVCKAAFDMFLALYHLYLCERRHRAVKTQNVIHLKQQEQFVLIDFECAYPQGVMESGEVPDAVDLVHCLAEMAGWNGSGGTTAATLVLEQVDSVLGSFAKYASTLKTAREVPDYNYWLHQLAAACGVDSTQLVSMMKKEY